MIFLLELYNKSRQSKIKAWEKARDAWVHDKDFSRYRSSREYEHTHPYPVLKWGKLTAAILPVFAALAVVSAIVFLVVIPSIKNDNKSDKPKTAQVEKKQPEYKVGDKVQVVRGDFKDSVGVLVKTDGVYILKLTNSTWTQEMAKAAGYSNGINNGSLLSVDSSNNLVPYKEVK